MSLDCTGMIVPDRGYPSSAVGGGAFAVGEGRLEEFSVPEAVVAEVSLDRRVRRSCVRQMSAEQREHPPDYRDAARGRWPGEDAALYTSPRDSSGDVVAGVREGDVYFPLVIQDPDPALVVRLRWTGTALTDAPE